MQELFRIGGPFMFGVVFFGLAALACNVLQFIRRDRNYTALLVGLVAATALVGICGTSSGIFQLTRAVMSVDADQQFKLFMSGLGVASTTTEMGALLAALNAALAGIAVWRRR
ncbi:MAG: hypothetical protein QGH45_24695 [Myxococcota bacterium]|jgi:cell division protein FtsX|nr:hypothetical protein [Myxococcota bacterium]